MDGFGESFKELERDELHEELLNRFLDLYSVWRRTGEGRLLALATEVAKDLELIDPEFHFGKAA
ncbi:MAG: hypothetical protein HYS41_04870 [Candidatus Omnitrophica bacterium]|nr:hypothetical protein [Candidatus Omnitrophota bacterium]